MTHVNDNLHTIQLNTTIAKTQIPHSSFKEKPQLHSDVYLFI